MTALAGFDVDAIQDYVFATARPIDILGGSQLIEHFGDHATDLAKAAGGKVVYVGGGAGTFEFPAFDDAHAFAIRVERELHDWTRGAARASAAAVPVDSEFGSAAAELAAAIARRKQTRWLDEPGTVLADVADPRALCQACGREPATHDDQLGGSDTEKIGERCHHRRRYGREHRHSGHVEQATDLNDLFGGRDTVVVDEPAGATGATGRRLLAAVYLDVDRAGERLARCSTSKELADLSAHLRDGTQRAFAEAVERLGLDGRVLAPVVGGDDVLVFVDAAVAGSLLSAILEGIDRYVTKPTGLHSSAGIVIAVRFLPLRLLTQRAGVALRAAKEASYRGAPGRAEPHISFHVVGRVRRSAPSDGVVFGAPMPASRWVRIDTRGRSDRTGADIGDVIDYLRDLPPAQRAGLLADLAQQPESLMELDIEYRATHRSSPSLAAAVEAAREVATATDARWWQVLAGALFALDLGW